MVRPSYRELLHTGELQRRVERALGLLKDCRICPRSCGVDRLGSEKGFCRTGRYARVASFGPHFGEEAPLVGTHGSGTIFMSSCNLMCTFCQNHEISHANEGAEVDALELASIMLDLTERGCHNINFVTPTHVVPQILEAVLVAARQGLDVPLVYNTGGYDDASTLRLLDGVFDIYMPDFKFWDEGPAAAFCRAPDYREKACEAIREMHSQVGDLEIDERGLAVRGLLLRHLVMPEGLAGTSRVMEFIATQISRDTYVNVMDQYHPCYRARTDRLIGRRITASEYMEALEAAMRAGIHRLDPHSRFAFIT
ncbi:MAG TPA: radical SAM protein [Deltaproteobacteria bacterium]|nr:radical SAM protein [Deltaproteobacteria bacterium]HOM29227.1 radical SAM protein [Deltaproteobacteria bacterium]HPP79961.1 radical SAM protein [Deltaproteobacteria bacterium]